MNVEKQIIGSLLIDASRIDEIKLITAEMFNDIILGEIFSVYANADGKEVNHFVVIDKLKSEFWTESKLSQLLAEITYEYDAGVSNDYCEEQIFKAYKAKKISELIEHTKIDSDSIDSFIDDISSLIDSINKKESEENICSLSELTKLQGEYFTENKKKKLKLGFETLDKAIGGIDAGDVAIIAARPAVGKSAFALQTIRDFGKQGFRVGYFNLEMSKKQVYERAIASASGIDMTRIRLATTFLNDEKELFDKGNAILGEEKNVYVIGNTQSLRKIRAYQKRYKFDVIVIDYLQLITPMTSRGSNRASEVGDISRGLKAIATEYNIPVIALSQLNRLSDKLKDKEPHLSELRESGDIEQDASVVLMLWNSNEDDTAEKTIKVEKSRNGYTDRTIIYFDGKHMRFKTDDSTDFETVTDNTDLPW